MALLKKQPSNLINSLSKLEAKDYSSTPELDNIYKRLQTGKAAFTQIYEMNVNAVSQISSLDMEIRFYTEQLLKITASVANATKDIHVAAEDSTDIAGVVAGRHEDLTNTIITVSEESSSVCEKIEAGQNELTDIRSLSQNTISISEQMQNDMNQLSKIINNMNEVISAINSISSQTNLLSLNASIEAARAGEAGRGFAVVADEIRSLADETKNLTENMGEFVTKVQRAAEDSVKSVGNAILSLENVNDKIQEVWVLNEENLKHVASITDSISNLAAVSEEISSSMNEIEARASEIEESCSILKEDTQGLQTIGSNCTEAVEPLADIEKSVDCVLVHMGKMSTDAFYSLSNEEITSYITDAISAHKKWIDNLWKIVSTKSIIPFQVDSNKCRFGHFYNSFNLQYANLISNWEEIGKMHKELHQLGSKIINALFDQDFDQANSLYESAKSYSTELIKKLEYISSLIQTDSVV